MNLCKYCHLEIHGRSVKIYCDNTCQQKYQQSEKIRVWLETGQAYVGTSKVHYVRTYLVEEQKHTCALCSILDEWRGMPLIFILDHIDGNPENNWRNNLRLICSNCDSQLDTYKGKNKGNGRHARRERYAKGQSY